MTNLDGILKSRDKGLYNQSYGFSSSLMYGCESWTIKKAEWQRIDAFELWCWRGLLRGPWTAERSNRSILTEISPEYSLEGLMLKLKLQYFVTDAKMWLFRKAPVLGKREGRRKSGNRRWDGWKASLTRCSWVWANLGSWWWTGKSGVLQSMGSQRVAYDWVTELSWIIRNTFSL